MRAVEVAGLTVAYGGVSALHDVTLGVDAGEICGLVGPNGSGKSTVFKALVGLLTPASGEICLHGSSIQAARRSGALGYVPQDERIDPDFPITVGEVVLAGRYARMGRTRRPAPVDRARVAQALDQVGMGSYGRRRMGALSGGQRKRVLLARAIAQDAQILLLDEPFNGVDRTSQSTVVELLRGLAADGVAVLVSSHDLAVLPQLVDRAVLLHRTVLADGLPADVLAPESLAQVFGPTLSSTHAPKPEEEPER